MTLWTAAVLLLLLASGITAMLILIHRSGKKLWMTVAVAALSLVLLATAAYILLTFIFIDAAENKPPDESPDVPVMETVSPAPAAAPEIPAAMPEDFDLAVSEVPALHPDVLGLRNAQYEEMPTLGTQDEVASFVLYKLLNEQFEFELYLTKDLAPQEGSGYAVLSRACETAMSYYLFSSYDIFDMYTEDRGEADRVYAKVKLVFTEAGLDLEARAEALEFVMKNPVPVGGFQDFEAEKAYAKKIHDYIASKITYSPIGYDPESMFGMKNYEALQEAYNVLGEEEYSAVCAGYARAFALIAQYAGINTAWVFGNETETESHAWNVIYPCDGSEPVLIDVTWDDGLSIDEPGQTYVSDTYFYIPLSSEYEHTAAIHFDEFLKLMNNR